MSLNSPKKEKLAQKKLNTSIKLASYTIQYHNTGLMSYSHYFLGISSNGQTRLNGYLAYDIDVYGVICSIKCHGMTCPTS